MNTPPEYSIRSQTHTSASTMLKLFHFDLRSDSKDY